MTPSTPAAARRLLRKLPPALVLTLVAVLAIATWIEKKHGAQAVYASVYGAWWFTALWGALAGTLLLGMVKGRMYKRLPLFLLHLSLIVILTGALCTKLFARRGTVTLRPGHVCGVMQTGTSVAALPFEIWVDTFYVTCYPGTDAPSDYVSHFSVRDKPSNRIRQGVVSMNNIFKHRGYRFYQTSFEAGGTTVLSLNCDRWGIPLTYAGYALFILSMSAWLLAPRSDFRRLLSHPALKRTVVVLMLMLPVPLVAGAVLTPDKLSVTKRHAAAFAELRMLYNGRIAPVATLACDFTMKMTGRTSFHYMDANQFLLGFLFFPDRWQHVVLFDVKHPDLKRILSLETRQAAWADFYDSHGNCKLTEHLNALSRNKPKSSLLKEIVQLNDRLQLIRMLHEGTLLQVCPQTVNGRLRWYAPTQNPATEEEQQNMATFRNHLLQYYRAIAADDEPATVESLRTVQAFQQTNATGFLPSDIHRTIEIFYITHPFTPLLFKVNLALGVVALLFVFLPGKRFRTNPLFFFLLLGSLLLHTLSIALRAVVSGRLPFGNGYETMLLLAWCAMLMAVIAGRKIPSLVAFGSLLSGSALLVAWLSMRNPPITPLAPVLLSPLLSIHVSTMIVAYTLLGFAMLNSLTALLYAAIGGKGKRFAPASLERYRTYGLVCLYPALLFLGAGIFSGAVWANVSWGRYWGWDPKEVWALISFLVYSLILHRKSIKVLSDPLFFHVFSVLSFLTVLMTYFGVNYFLGGMHSY
jgi:ABC-type transport system involved in cytochrome c biogenesis permease subunit